LASGIDQHWYRVVSWRCHPMNVADKAALLTFAPVMPIQITLVPVITPEPAEIPRAVLESPVVF